MSSRVTFANTSITKSGRRGSNPRPTAWKAVALPTELLPHCYPSTKNPDLTNRSDDFRAENQRMPADRGQGWIRTTELRRGQIYSLLPLATWLLARLVMTRLTPDSFWLPRPTVTYFNSTSQSGRPPDRHASQRRDSNPRPADYKSAALPTELLWLIELLPKDR